MLKHRHIGTGYTGSRRRAALETEGCPLHRGCLLPRFIESSCTAQLDLRSNASLLLPANRSTVHSAAETNGRDGAAGRARCDRRRCDGDDRRTRRATTTWGDGYRTTNVTAVPVMMAMVDSHATSCGRRTTIVGPRRHRHDEHHAERHDGKGNISHNLLHGLSPQEVCPGSVKNMVCPIAVRVLGVRERDPRSGDQSSSMFHARVCTVRRKRTSDITLRQ